MPGADPFGMTLSERAEIGPADAQKAPVGPSTTIIVSFLAIGIAMLALGVLLLTIVL